jgi:transcriptional regulator with XRE-family HTH domain
MNRSSYGERDYAFGQQMLTLRTHIGLTQAGLANLLGISRRALAEWEAGNSYPEVDHLKRLIALGVRASAFAAGHEEEQIHAFWKAAHQKVLLDEHWLSELLARPAASPAQPVGEPSPGSELMAQLASQEAGQPMVMRRAALTQAQVIKGLGGIGKTQIAVEYTYRARAGAL